MRSQIYLGVSLVVAMLILINVGVLGQISGMTGFLVAQPRFISEVEDFESDSSWWTNGFRTSEDSWSGDSSLAWQYSPASQAFYAGGSSLEMDVSQYSQVSFRIKTAGFTGEHLSVSAKGCGIQSLQDTVDGSWVEYTYDLSNCDYLRSFSLRMRDSSYKTDDRAYIDMIEFS